MTTPRDQYIHATGLRGDAARAARGVASGHDPLRGRRVGSARAIYRLLGSKGGLPAEAGNLTAFLSGLAPVASGWSIDEVERLLFVRNLVDHGRLRS